ncbi:uncharacterized protein LOC129005653 [Macrosteles quadrilineatus]|uniref:uncharacterized protein LOC129005653 n=1 Tax=Macrosteles quadrilineatus TaxID=74068 RepID=UPI0023E2A4EB|nr:uncharacterized protein LOC129005653 [Macrosteles quadrilineatus]
MIAQARVASTGIRRSRSAVFTEDFPHRGTPARRTICQPNYQHRVIPQYQEPPMSSWEPLLPQNRNLAVIPPNARPRPHPRPEPLPPSPNKGSWATLPASTPTNTLFLSGLFLIFASTINCLLCFYLLAKKGRHYYIDLAVMSGFAMLVLGYAAVRTGRWDWVFNRNYLAGYMVLSMLDVLLCGVLGLLASDWRPPEVASVAMCYMVLSMLDVLLCGVLGLLASDWRPPEMPEIVEVASGAVFGLSALMLLLALILCASSCCKHPPPDNRVSHSVPSLIV